ncbi:MAG TPA: class II glutamine amidotransferase [Nevskiaceae bacterium]|nr:class II glutamine amidotransferase [Nevskiaceae bacterium]
MCELLGMSANTPTDLCFSFTGLTRRGGATGPHKDGWGVAFYDGAGVREFKDSLSSAASPIAKLLQNYPIRSETAICHIRQANVGAVSLANTHPFIRALWGRYWVFAHNGQIAGSRAQAGAYEPVGDTDSEAIFCDLLNGIRRDLPRDVNGEALAEYVARQAARYAAHGVFNCLLSNGEWLFTYCGSRLASITRRAPFGPAALKDADVKIDFAAVTTPHDIVSLIATEPLTSDERWEAYRPGEWKLWQGGEVITRG